MVALLQLAATVFQVRLYLAMPRICRSYFMGYEPVNPGLIQQTLRLRILMAVCLPFTSAPSSAGVSGFGGTEGMVPTVVLLSRSSSLGGVARITVCSTFARR